jgi:hypothetical protein
MCCDIYMVCVMINYLLEFTLNSSKKNEGVLIESKVTVRSVETNFTCCYASLHLGSSN